LALGTVSRLLEETKSVALRLLETRANSFSKRENSKIVQRISSEVYSHSHSISRTEAIKYLGLKQVKNAEEIDIADDLWNLYKEYKELFSLENPFKPEEYLISNNLEEYVWKDLNIACVESLERFDINKQDLRVRRLRKVPPQVNLNLNNLHLPTINIPNLPPNITQEEIKILIKQIVINITQQYIFLLIQDGKRRNNYENRKKMEC
jgi:hypothetical protein